MADNRSDLIACRCSNCGAPIEIQEGQEFATCEYCDTVFKVKTDKDRLVDMLVYGGAQYAASSNKKGIAERALEDKRRREEAKAREAAAERERQFRAEQAEKEREFRAEQAEIARKRDPGYILVQLLLWACFYPVMLLAVILKRLSEKNRNNELIAKGIPPKKVTEFPLLYMIVCGLIFFSIFSGFIFTPTSYSSNSSNVASEPTATSIATTKPTVTPDSKWFEQETIEFQNTSFTEETVIEAFDDIRYEVPKSWNVDSKDHVKTYYPYKGVSGTLVYIGVSEIDGISNEYFDDHVEEIFDGIYKSLMSGEKIISSEARHCILNGNKGMTIISDYKMDEENVVGKIIITMFHRKNQIIQIGTMMDNDKYSEVYEDYCAVLNSLQITY